MAQTKLENFHRFVYDTRLHRDEVLPDSPIYHLHQSLLDLDCLLNSIHSILCILHGSTMYHHQLKMLASCSDCIHHYSAIVASEAEAFLIKHLNEAPISSYEREYYD